MAGKYGSPSLTISYDDGPGGTLRDVSAHVRKIGGIKVTQINEQNMPFGTAFQKNTPVGVQDVADIVIEGDFDTTATTGPHVVFGTPDVSPQASTRSFKFQPGDSKSFDIETRLVEYEVVAENGKLTGYKATVRQAGLGAWT